ncbi:unnamed protein product [Owenia fusiformis]|uniref:Uncharacterized protein n=1 Tax=Owenia fusiformis TaxID=6347 RepID=A0A8J1XE41_OWEFU|nr:unnamed protein product [Owenia fusiformis]
MSLSREYDNMTVLIDPNKGTPAFTYFSEYGERMKNQEYLELMVLMTICTTSVIGNSLVIAAVMKKRSMRNPTNYLIVNLSMSDLLFVMMTPFIMTTRITVNWKLGGFLCRIVSYIQFFSAANSILTMMLISIDRYRSICIINVTKLTTKVGAVIICCVWMVSLTMTLPIALFSIETHITQWGKEHVFCGLVWPKEANPDIYFSVLALFLFIMPVTTLIVNYCRIFNTVRKSSKVKVIKVTSKDNHKEQDQISSKQIKLLKMFVLIVALFIAMILPFFAASFVVLFTDTMTSTIFTWSVTLTLANTAINPIIYGYFNTKFKQAYKELLCKRCTRKVGHERSISNSQGTHTDGE